MTEQKRIVCEVPDCENKGVGYPENPGWSGYWMCAECIREYDQGGVANSHYLTADGLPISWPK